MKTLKIVVVVAVAVATLLAAGFFILDYFRPKAAGLRVDTAPGSSVYINSELVGRTPFRKTFPAGTITLRLVPDSASPPLLPYEAKIALTGGIETVARREFGVSEDLSSGDVLTFEKTGGSSASLIVISTPDNAQVSLDGVPRGFAPYKSSSISSAEHQITVTSIGYQNRVMTVNTLSGYQLTVFAKLAKESQESVAETSSPSATPAPKTYVVILKTPTGFLRVRTLPGAAGEEIAEVKPGEKFPYIDTDAATGWYKIQYEEPAAGLPNGITGWVSDQYTQIATESAIPQ